MKIVLVTYIIRDDDDYLTVNYTQTGKKKYIPLKLYNRSIFITLFNVNLRCTHTYIHTH